MPANRTGLGYQHQQTRKALLRALTPGTPCDLCGGPMFSDHALDVDHIVPRVEGGASGPVRLVHRTCNTRRGQRLGQQRKHAARPATCRVHGPRCADGPHSRAW